MSWTMAALVLRQSHSLIREPVWHPVLCDTDSQGPTCGTPQLPSTHLPSTRSRVITTPSQPVTLWPKENIYFFWFSLRLKRHFLRVFICCAAVASKSSKLSKPSQSVTTRKHLIYFFWFSLRLKRHFLRVFVCVATVASKSSKSSKPSQPVTNRKHLLILSAVAQT